MTITTKLFRCLALLVHSVICTALTSYGQTDTHPPTVLSSMPVNGERSAPINTRVTAAFSKAMDSATINTDNFSLMNASNVPVGGTFSYDQTTRRASFFPSTSLLSDETYTAKITTGVKDTSGNPLVVGFSWSFTAACAGFVETFEDSASVAANWSPYGSAFSASGGVGRLWPDGSIVPIWRNHRATVHDKGREPITLGDLIYTVDVRLPGALRTCLSIGWDSGNRRLWLGYAIGSAVVNWSNDLESDVRGAGTWWLVADYRPYDNQWHKWRVEVHGAQFDFYVDSHHVITGQLIGYLPGPIGMRSWDSGGAQFHNVVAVPTDFIVGRIDSPARSGTILAGDFLRVLGDSTVQEGYGPPEYY